MSHALLNLEADLRARINHERLVGIPSSRLAIRKENFVCNISSVLHHNGEVGEKVLFIRVSAKIIHRCALFETQNLPDPHLDILEWNGAGSDLCLLRRLDLGLGKARSTLDHGVPLYHGVPYDCLTTNQIDDRGNTEEPGHENRSCRQAQGPESLSPG